MFKNAVGLKPRLIQFLLLIIIIYITN